MGPIRVWNLIIDTCQHTIDFFSMDWINKINKRNEEEGLQLRSKKTGKTCLFCGIHKEKSKVDCICPDCVQVMLMASQEELQRSYGKAIRIGSHNFTKFQGSTIHTFVKKLKMILFLGYWLNLTNMAIYCKPV